MKRFKVENTRRLQTIVVSLSKGPYTQNNILNKTGWDKKDCNIQEVHHNFHTDGDGNPSQIDHIGEENK